MSGSQILRMKLKEIDYTNPVCQPDLDIEEYNNKFKVVDRYISGDQTLLLEIIQDITMFSYLFFRVDGKPIRLYPYQDKILNDPHRFKIFRAARQIGKSLSLDIKAAYNLCVNHGHSHNESIISASLHQAGFQMRRVKALLNSANFDWKISKGAADNTSVVTVDIKDQKDNTKVLYTNMLVVAPCTEGALGYDFHEVNLDETEYWSDVDLRYFFNQIIEPTVSATKGRLTSFSNPNGADTYIAELERQTLPDGTKKYHTYVFNFLDRPGSTQHDLDLIAAGKTRQELESQYLAIRTLSDRCFFTSNEIIDSEDKELNDMNMLGKPAFFFLDVGYTVDQSCLVGGYIETKEGYDDNKGFEYNRPYIELYIPIIHLYPVGYPLSRIIGSTSETEMNDGWHQEKSVKDYLDEWKIGTSQSVFGFDATGNKGMIPLFEELRIEYKDITWTGPEKSSYWTRFKYLMEKRLLHRITHTSWEDQAKKVIATKSARGYWLINAKNKKGEGGSQQEPDDCLSATAGLIAIADPQNYIKESLVII